MDEAAGLREFDHPARDSITLGVELKNVQSEIANLVRGSTAVSSPDDFELPSTKARRTKFNKDSARLVLRAFNAEVENIIDSATATNYETCVNRIYKSAEALEKLIEVLGVKINPRYLELRIRELNIATRHLDAKKLERELDRERKAQLREQAQAERELEAERQRLEKERQHYFNVLETVQAMGDESEVAKLQAEIVAIEKGIHDVEAREANIRAGYVYVISNIGSFGERLVKIGMTRRLDPMDRVRELGDASVPFNFDVHAMFFSDDAVGVEAELHRRFADKRANLVNTRREFFAVTPHEVREALTAIDGNLLEFTEEAEAEQFRLSQRLRESQLA